MRACWLKWVGRDWSISADYIWLNYSGANNRHALGLHALHDALDGARAEVVGVRFHRQAVDTHDRLRLALADAVPHHLQHLVGDEVLAGAVGLHDGLDQVCGTSL